MDLGFPVSLRDAYGRPPDLPGFPLWVGHVEPLPAEPSVRDQIRLMQSQLEALRRRVERAGQEEWRERAMVAEQAAGAFKSVCHEQAMALRHLESMLDRLIENLVEATARMLVCAKHHGQDWVKMDDAQREPWRAHARKHVETLLRPPVEQDET